MTAKFSLAAGAMALVAASFATPATAASRDAMCRDYAYRVANRNANGDVLAGTVGGAATGALLGAIIGHGKGSAIGKGAIIGGVGGTALGAIGSTSSRKRAFSRAYWSCMDDAGYTQPQGYYSTRGSARAADVRYCMNKYRSYNPRTGMYLTYSGEYRACP